MRSRRSPEVDGLGEVGDDGLDAETGVIEGDGFGGAQEVLAGDVDRDVGSDAFEAIQRVEQEADLEAAAAAVLDQCAVGAKATGHGRGVALEDREFGAGGVVLLQLGDGIEERGAVFVVEVLGGEPFLGRGEAAMGVLGEL